MSTALEALTTVVVNWETASHTVRCVEALERDGVPPNRIVVVDNGSSDASFERLKDRLSRCAVLRLERNVGWAAAANAAARELPGDAYLFVDNDAFVHAPGSVRTLLAAAERPSVGIVTPRIVNPDLSLQPTVAPIQTPGVALVRASGVSRLIPNRWQPRWSTHWDHASSREIRGMAGPVLLVRGPLWQELGGFTEAVYMYAEDLDACWRAQKAGWKIWFAADAVFVHVGGASTRPRWSLPQRAEMVGRSEAAMIRRHLSALPATLSIGLVTTGCAVRWLAFTALGRCAAAQHYRGLLRGYMGSI